MKPRLLPLVFALLCAVPGEAGARAVRGAVDVPGAGAGARAASRAKAAALRSEAVVYLDWVPDKVERRLAREAEKRARKTGVPTIIQAKRRFTPRVLPVVVGTTVRFENRDRVYHSVFSVSPAKRFDVGKYPPGQGREVTFDRPGVVAIFCDIDPTMSGHVLVVPNHAFARPDSTGAFAFPKLPRGAYTLRVWHPALGSLSRAVEIPRRGDAVVDLSF